MVLIEKNHIDALLAQVLETALEIFGARDFLQDQLLAESGSGSTAETNLASALTRESVEQAGEVDGVA